MTEPRYPISTLEDTDTPVMLTVFDTEFVGDMTFSKSGLRQYRVRNSAGETVKLSKFAQPSLWRPIGEWPFELPEPAVVTRDKPKEDRQATRNIDDTESGDGWPYPHIKLGAPGTPPVSMGETEARLLRAIRTLDVVMRRPRRSESTWPPALLVRAKAVEKYIRSQGRAPGLREGDYDYFHIDHSELNAYPEHFIPTHRDVSDVDQGVFRWAGSDRLFNLILHMKAANPPFSLQQIAEREHLSIDDVAKAYAKGLNRAFEKARA